MSGRLVILPHKSWNVWNQDNRERVLRDERLHREQESEKRKLARERDQERTFNALVEHDQAEETKSAPERFCLFDEPARIAQHQHPDFMREQEEKEQRKRKREGVSDWALGKGDFVSDASSLWYNRASYEPTAKPQDNVRDLDPMSKYHLDSRDVIESKDTSDQEELSILRLDGKELLHEPSARGEDAGESGRRKKRGKTKNKDKDKDKSRNRKKDSDREREEDEDEEDDYSSIRKRQHKEKHRREDRCRSPHVSSIDQERRDSSWMAELRHKRLQREKVEHQKETRLLAQSDVFGPQAVAGGGFNSQFHPQLARPR